MEQLEVMETKLTNADYDYFTLECKRYADLLGLDDWQIGMAFNFITDNTGAEVTYIYNQHQAIITLSTLWRNLPVTQENLSKMAFHEVLHIVMTDLEGVAVLEGLPHETLVSLIDREQHKIIRRFENVFFDYVKPKDAA